MNYYEELYHETNRQLMETYQTIGSMKFRVDHLFEALERIANCDDLDVAKAIAQARIELCADWKSNIAKEITK